MRPYLRPSGPVAADAILTGDPKRAMELATDLLDAPRMSNLSRGLWGYYGTAPGGAPLTVQATGIGAPSAAIVMHELQGLGVRRAIRVGTCTALGDELAPGTLLVVCEALAGDGVSAALGSSRQQAPDAELTERVAGALGHLARQGAVLTRDLVHDPAAHDRHRQWRSRGAAAADLATAPLLTLASRLGVRAAAALVVAETTGGERLDEAALDAAANVIARAAAAALAGAAAAQSAG